MLRLRLPAVPRESLAVDLRSRQFPTTWAFWLRALVGQVDASPFRVQTVNLTAQAATIPATAVPIASLPAYLYRVSYYLRITRAATTSSSATVALTWKDGTVSCSFVGAAVTGNTTATVQTGTMLIRVGQDGPITYGVAYASVGATAMLFDFQLCVEAIPGVAS